MTCKWLGSPLFISNKKAIWKGKVAPFRGRNLTMVINHLRVGDDPPSIDVVSRKIPKTTPPKTNMSPENRWLEDVFPTERVPF